VAWLFMTYAFRRMGSTKALVLFAIISFGCLVGMPWFILDLVLSVVISIVYTPIIITQDAIAIISGASFAIRTIENSEGSAPPPIHFFSPPHSLLSAKRRAGGQRRSAHAKAIGPSFP
jgi:hypothetical protein